MSEEVQPTILKMLHEYRKQISLLKTKSFYANHLCKRNCLVGKLHSNPKPCFEKCDHWLDNFYKLKKESYPQVAENFVFDLDKASQVSQADRRIFIQGYAEAKQNLRQYVATLNAELEDKIHLEKK